MREDRRRWLGEIEDRACRAKDGSGEPLDVLAGGTLALVRELRRLDPTLAPEDRFVASLRDVGHARLSECAAEGSAHEALDEVLDSVASYVGFHGGKAVGQQHG